MEKGLRDKAGSQVLDPALSLEEATFAPSFDYCCERLADVVVAGACNSPWSLA